MNNSIDRFQDRESISCSDPKFNKHLCLTKEDFMSFVETYMLGCVKWKKDEPLLSPKETEALFDLMLRVNGQR